MKILLCDKFFMANAKDYKSTIEWLNATIAEYLALNPHVSKETFGYRCMRETGFVDRLKNGGDITTRKLDAVIAYMANPNKQS